MSEHYTSWGRHMAARQQIRRPAWVDELDLASPDKTILTYGNGRSYGDSCLNDGGILVDLRKLDHFIHFDSTNGILRCEAGLLFTDILSLIVKQGWFLPVTPGTRYITVGGAIANDVHGKNHHRAGTFGMHIKQFELCRSTGERLVCSPTQNPLLFNATIGGLGLTGTILWAEFALKKIASPMIEAESIRFETLDDFFELSAESDKNYEYTVAWVDCLAKGKAQGRGIFIRGNHASREKTDTAPCTTRTLSIPAELPISVVNPFTLKIFNEIYFKKHPRHPKKHSSHYAPFFYPLDAIENWNRMYGKKGFFQYQCVVPVDQARQAISELLQHIASSRTGSFLAVLKMFGPARSPGLLSFPREGVTLALDFANQGQKTLDLLESLDNVVAEYGGAVYPAKDARMNSGRFKQYFPRWQEFQTYIDKNYSSSFWRRVMEVE